MTVTPALTGLREPGRLRIDTDVAGAEGFPGETVVEHDGVPAGERGLYRRDSVEYADKFGLPAYAGLQVRVLEEPGLHRAHGDVVVEHRPDDPAAQQHASLFLESGKPGQADG